MNDSKNMQPTGAGSRRRKEDLTATAALVVAFSLGIVWTSVAQTAPSVKQLTPAQAPAGARMVLTGENLLRADLLFVQPNASAPARIITRQEREIELAVPPAAPSGNLRVTANGVVRDVPFTKTADPAYTIVSTIASKSSGLKSPYGVAVTPNGNVYVVERNNHLVRLFRPDGTSAVLAGSGRPDFVDGTGAAAAFKDPMGITFDAALYVSDSGNHAIRRVTLDGIVTTIAGGGSPGLLDAVGRAAKFHQPVGLAVDAGGQILVADSLNNRIRRIAKDGTVTSIAGGAMSGPKYDDGPAATATFHHPEDVAVDGEVTYVADTQNNAVRKLDRGTVSTVIAGPKTPDDANADDGRTGDPKIFKKPAGIDLDEAGDLIVSDTRNRVLRKISLRSTPATMSLIAGTGKNGSTDGPALEAEFRTPAGVAVAGAVFVADPSDESLRIICPEVRLTGLLLGGKPVAGSEVRLFGTGFVPGRTKVTFNGVAAAGVKWVTSTAIVATLADAIRSSSADVVVTACGGATPVTKFPIDTTPPVVEIVEGSVPIVDQAKFARIVTPEIKVTDDLDPSPKIVATLNGLPFTSSTAITADGQFTLVATAEDFAGNKASKTVRFMIDRTPPVVRVMERGAPFPRDPDGTFHFNRDVKVDLDITDISATTVAATLNGSPHVPGTLITAEGSHTFIAKVTDELGHATSIGPIAFVIDRTAPVITFTSPKQNEVITAPRVVVKGTTADATALRLDGQPVTIDAATKTFTTSERTIVEGESSLSFIATDRAGNSAPSILKVVLDTRAPELMILSPKSAACIPGNSVEIRGTVSDPRVDSVKVISGSTTLTATLDAAKRNWVATLPLQAEGRIDVTVEARDTAGHVATKQFDLRVDRTAPVVHVTENGAPFNGGILNRRVVPSVRIDDADAAVKFTAAANGVAWTSGTPVATEGTHTLRIEATDCAGNRSEKSFSFTIDTIAPVIRSLSPPSGSSVGQRPQQITGVTDPDVVRVEIAGTSVAATPDATGAFALAPLALQEGTNRSTISARDRAGNVASIDYVLSLKSTAPFVEIVVDGAPVANGALFNRAVAPVIRTNEPGLTISATHNGSPFVSGTSIAAEGAHQITVQATDAFGHRVDAAASFTIDRSPPVVKITSPAPGSVSTDSIAVQVNGGDSSSVTINGFTAMPVAPSWTATIPLEAGENAIVASGRDRAGNVGHDQIVVTRDGGGPAIIVTHPLDRSVTNRAKVDVAGRVASPAAVTNLWVNGVATSFDASGAFRAGAVALKEGANQLLVTAKGEGGRTSTVAITVTADFAPPVVRILESGQPFADGDRFAEKAVISASTTEGALRAIVDGSEVLLPSTITSQGGHTVVVTARDAAGNETREERTFFIGASGSSAACSLGTFDPIGGSTITSSSFTLTGRSGGAAGVKVNGVPAMVANGSFCATVELPREGANEVTITCTDSRGEGTGAPQSLTFHRITGAPSIAIQTPEESLVTAAETIRVSGTADGAVSVEVNESAATVNGSAFDAPRVHLNEGLNIIVARARSASGRTASASRRVTRLVDAPIISISSPLPGLITGASRIDVSGTFRNLDPSTLTSSVASPLPIVAIQSDTTGSFLFENIPLSAGEQTLTISGRDALGRAATASIAISMSPGAPSIAISAPRDQSHFPASSEATFVVRGSYEGAAGSSVEVNGVPAALDPATKSFSATIGFTTSTTPVVARITQPDGNGTFDTIRVTKLPAVPKVLEIFPPAGAAGIDGGVLPLILFSAPMDRASLISAVSLTSSAGAPVSGVQRLDGDVVTFAPATLLTSGEKYQLRISTLAKDLAGQPIAADVTADFTIATTASQLAPSLNPVPSRICGSFVELSGTATPGARIRIDLGTLTWTTTAASNGAFSFRVPLSGPSGFQVIRVSTLGADGSRSPAAEAKFATDCSGPQVSSATYDRATNRITIVFSKEIRPPALTAFTPSGVITHDGSTVVLTPAEDLRTRTFTLTIAAVIEDTAGVRMQSSYSRTFALDDAPGASGDGRGFVSGEVYDASTGRPLAGAVITIDGSITLTTDARGRYLARLGEGPHRLRATKDGYLEVIRAIVIPAGVGVTPIDIRLKKETSSR